MVAINEILLSECTGEECGGETDICTDSRVHCGDAENRAPVTRNHRSAPIPGRWMEQDPAHYINGANTYQFVDSSPVGNVDASGFFWDGGFHGWWALLYAVPFVGWAWGAGHAMGEGVVALQNLGNDAEAAHRGQLRLVNQAANPNAPAPASAYCPAMRRTIRQAARTEAKLAKVSGTTSGGPLPTPGVTTETNVAKAVVGATVGAIKN